MPDFNMAPFTDIRPELQISWSPSSIMTIANYVKQCKEVMKNLKNPKKNIMAQAQERIGLSLPGKKTLLQIP